MDFPALTITLPAADQRSSSDKQSFLGCGDPPACRVAKSYGVAIGIRCFDQPIPIENRYLLGLAPRPGPAITLFLRVHPLIATHEDDATTSNFQSWKRHAQTATPILHVRTVVALGPGRNRSAVHCITATAAIRVDPARGFVAAVQTRISGGE